MELMEFTPFQSFAIGASFGWGNTFTAEARDPSSWALFYSRDGFSTPAEAFNDAKKWAEENSPSLQIDNFVRSGIGPVWDWSDGDNVIQIFNQPGTHAYGFTVNGMIFNRSCPSVNKAATEAFDILQSKTSL